MTCPVPQCQRDIRWHNRLCREHARMVPQSLQMDIYRIAALLVKAKRREIIREYGRRYVECLKAAVASVTP